MPPSLPAQVPVRSSGAAGSNLTGAGVQAAPAWRLGAGVGALEAGGAVTDAAVDWVGTAAGDDALPQPATPIRHAITKPVDRTKVRRTSVGMALPLIELASGRPGPISCPRRPAPQPS